MKSKTIVNIKKLISVLICTMLISSTLPPNLLNYVVFAANTSVSTFDELKAAVESANDDDVITLTSDITVPNSATATEENYHCLLNCSKNITITSVSGQTYTINHRSPDGLLAMTDGCTVTFANITIDFGRTNDDSNFNVDNTLIKLYSGSTLNMKSGTTLQNAYVKNGSPIYCTGSNINIDETSNIINLSTSENSANKGTIYAENNSTINLNGTISNCSAQQSGGAIHSESSTLILNGTISNCSAKNGGAISTNSTLILNGTISNCSATASTGGAISSSKGGTLTINGTISSCSSNGTGGAIFSASSTLTLNGTIKDCIAKSGGAINSMASTLTLNGTISNCSATSTSTGGGAFCNSMSSTLQILGGSISGCSATNSSGKGNAIYNAPNSTIYLPTSDTNLFSITVPNNAQGTDNGQDKYGYAGIYDANTSTQARFLYYVQFDFNGGVDSNSNTSTDPVLVMGGESLGDMLPSNLTKTMSGVALNLYRWVDSNKNEVTSSTAINNNTTLHAKYGAPQISSPTLPKEDSGSTYTAGDLSNENITLSYYISSPDIAINPQNYKISLDGTTFNDASIYSSSDTLRIDSLDASTLTFTIIKGGEYQIRIQAFDSDGLSATSDAVSVKIDTVSPDPATIDNSEDSNVDTVELYGTGEIGCTVTATDENNNVIGTAIVDANGEWSITTSSMPDGQHTISVVQTDMAKNTSEPVTKDIIVDTTPPTGSISIDSDNFSQFLNTITFGLLFTETATVTISASDAPDQPGVATSGIKTIEYFQTDQVYENYNNIPKDVTWISPDLSANQTIEYDIAWPLNDILNNIGLTPIGDLDDIPISFGISIPQIDNNKFFIYSRITDNAGNETFLRSDGVIMYTDSVITTDEISYTKLDMQDKDLSVALNGNTVSSITNGNTALVKNSDYSIENSKITLKHEYLNSLDAADYELTIHFAPAAETNLDPNATLPSSTVTLYVEKANQQQPPEDAKFNNLSSQYTYGDAPVTISLNGGGSGTGSAVTYTSTNPNIATINPTTGELTILKAGTFKIIATKAADDNYNELVVTSDEIAVNRRNVTITGITAQSKTYDGNTNAEFDITTAQINNLVNNDQVTIQPGSATFTDKNAANLKAVSFSGFALTGTDAANYTLSAQPAYTTANITPKSATITGVTAEDKVYDGSTDVTPVTSSASIDGTVSGDELSFTTGTASFSDKNVANGKTVTFSGFALAGTDAANYTLSAQPADTTANILVKPLTISDVAIKDKVFDGSTTAEFDGDPTLEGLIDGDDVTLINGTPVFTSAEVGTSILINFSTPFSLEGSDASNYSITQPSNIYGNIIETDSSDSSTTNDTSDTNSESSSSEVENDTISGPFEAEDPATGIQVSAPEGVIPPWYTLVVDEIYPNTEAYTDTYDDLDEQKKASAEHSSLYEIHLEDQDGNVVQPNTSMGLVTVRIPVPNNYDLDDLEVYRINEASDDDFDENIVTINNKNYCEYRTDHFSPYAMIDKNTIYDIIQSILPYLILFLILLFIALFIIIIWKRRKDKEEDQQQQ